MFLSEWDSREGFLISAGRIAGLLDPSCVPCGWLPRFTTLLQENLFNRPQMCCDGTSDVIWSDPLLFSVPCTDLRLKMMFLLCLCALFLYFCHSHCLRPCLIFSAHEIPWGRDGRAAMTHLSYSGVTVRP